MDDSDLTYVRVMRVKAGMHLVEWTDEDDILQRAWVTDDMVAGQEGNYAYVDNPSAGIPVGVPFSSIVEFNANPKDLERELHKQGVWTADDAKNNRNAVRSALQAVYGVDVAQVLRTIDRYEQDLRDTGAENNG